MQDKNARGCVDTKVQFGTHVDSCPSQPVNNFTWFKSQMLQVEIVFKMYVMARVLALSKDSSY